MQDLDLVAQKHKERTLNPVGRGRGMIHRADKYLAQQHGREPEWVPGLAPALPIFPDRAATPDDYHLAREPSEFEYDTEETNPEDPEDGPKEDDDDASVGSDSTYKSSGHDMDRTHRTNTAHWNQRCWEVEEYLRKGYNDNRIKDAMLSLVEGQAYVNFRSCDEERNRTLVQILKEMDSIYNVSVTFQDLNARMCGLKQGTNKPIKAR